MRQDPTPFHPLRRGNPKSNAERQADFRRRNPDYYRQYRLKLKARVAAAAQQAAAEKAAPPVRVPLVLPAPPVRLCLPAPSQEPVFILPLQRPERELVPATPAPTEEPKRLAA